MKSHLNTVLKMLTDQIHNSMRYTIYMQLLGLNCNEGLLFQSTLVKAAISTLCLPGTHASAYATPLPTTVVGPTTFTHTRQSFPLSPLLKTT